MKRRAESRTEHKKRKTKGALSLLSHIPSSFSSQPIKEQEGKSQRESLWRKESVKTKQNKTRDKKSIHRHTYQSWRQSYLALV
jgi:hypothetical protein